MKSILGWYLLVGYSGINICALSAHGSTYLYAIVSCISYIAGAKCMHYSKSVFSGSKCTVCVDVCNDCVLQVYTHACMRA